MNDQHPHAGYVGYDNNPTGSFDTDPLFGALPGHQDGSRDLYDTGPAPVQHGDGAYGNGYDSAYPAGQQEHSEQYAPQWDTGAHQQAPYDAYAAQSHPQAAQNYGTTDTWTPDAVIPDVVIPAPAAAQDATGQWDTTGWDHSGQAGQWANGDTGAFPTSTFSTTAFGTGTYDTAGYDTAGYANAAYGTAGYDTTAYDTTTTGTGYAGVGLDTGAYDATAWNVGATPGTTSQEPEQTSYPSYEQAPSEPETASYEPYATHEHAKRDYEAPGYEAPAYETSEFHTSDFRTAGYEAREHSAPEPEVEEPEAPEATEPEAGTEADRPDRVTEVPAARPAGRSGSRSAGGRGRRRTPAKRSALLTVAVPSACVMSVAGIAAASVGGVGGGEEKKDETTSMAAADPGTVKPVEANNELDTQLANLSADAENFADRASRTQERIDLKARQAADKKKRAEEAARREALRPKFVLPVKQHGLSAYYGQAGVNWMSVHTGIDFPVAYGTPVMAATDGTVRTQYNSAYGNMAIVTAADGTETWYCHLSSTKIRSGSVQAGDVIAYAGDSGNSTGAHLHFEVRPGGGAAIDPMQWLRSHGLNPT